MCRVITLANSLTHWGRVTHICVVKLTIIGSDNGLSPGRRQAIIWTNAGILSIGPLGTNFSEILIGIQTFSFKKMHFKMASAKWRPFCLGLNVLITTNSPILNEHPDEGHCMPSIPAIKSRDQSWYVPSQWEKSLQYNDFSHWLDTYLAWSLQEHPNLDLLDKWMINYNN